MEEVVLTTLQVERLQGAMAASSERRLSSRALREHIDVDDELERILEKLHQIDSTQPLKLTFPEDVPFDDIKSSLLALCGLSGEAIQVEDEVNDYWYSLGVDPTASPVAANGTGPNPLHVDMLTFSDFPRGMAILCERPDPQGGGATILAPHGNVRAILTEEEAQILTLPIFSYWRDSGLINVGEHIEHFSILPTSQDDSFRFTSKFPRRFEQHPPSYPDRESANFAHEAIKKISTFLDDQALRLNLKSREAVLYSQLQFCHGRTGLGDGQDLIPPGDHRQLWRMYFNSVASAQ